MTGEKNVGQTPSESKQTVLFLCTGNYYRSRYAEIVFNSLAAQSGIPWQAESRALKISGRNVGPISEHTRTGLSQRGLSLPAELRFPMEVTEAELQSAERIIAVKEAEHRVLFDQKFPSWTARVEFWHIHDIDCSDPSAALPELHAAVEKLHEDLRDAE